MQRVFIGIPVDKRLQREINEVLKPFNTSTPNIRWVAETNRHLTLAFIGMIPNPKVKVLSGHFEQAYRGCSQFQYRFSRLARFPGAASRLVALTGEPDAALGRLVEFTRRFLGNHGVGFDGKQFRPHVTLGRISRKGQLNAGFFQAIDMRLEVDRVRLYQSTLTESGSIYSTLSQAILGKPCES